MKQPFPPESPKQCPCGHTHVSWTAGEDDVYCWDCNKKYPLTECFGAQVSIPSSNAEDETSN